MKTPLIDKLDLRPSPLTAKRKPEADWQWNWPVFPLRVAKCIETGIFPLHSAKVARKINVVLHFDVGELQQSLAETEALIRGISKVMGTKAYNRQWITQESVWPGNLLAIGCILGSIAFIAGLAWH